MAPWLYLDETGQARPRETLLASLARRWPESRLPETEGSRADSDSGSPREPDQAGCE